MTSVSRYACFTRKIRRPVALACVSLLVLFVGCDAAEQEASPSTATVAPRAESNGIAEVMEVSGQALDLGYEEEAQVLPVFASRASLSLSSAAYATASGIVISGMPSTNPTLPTSISLSPTGISATVGGQTTTSTFEPEVRDAMADLTARVDAALGTSAVSRLPDGRQFRDLSFAGKIQLMQQRGYVVEDLGNGRFKLTRRAGADPNARGSIPTGNGLEISMIVEPGAQASFPQTEVRMGGQLIYEQAASADERRPATLVRPGSSGGSQRLVQFNASGASQ